METKVEHTPAVNQRGDVTRCPACNGYHYTCFDCGVDCTMGSNGGPAHQDVEGIIRCVNCYHKHQTKLALLHAAAPEMLEVLELMHRLTLQTPTLANDPDSREVMDRAWTVIHKARGTYE